MPGSAFVYERYRRSSLRTLVPIAQQSSKGNRISYIFGVRESRESGNGICAEIVRTEAGCCYGAEDEGVGAEIVAARAFVLLQETFSNQSGEQPTNRSLAQAIWAAVRNARAGAAR